MTSSDAGDEVAALHRQRAVALSFGSDPERYDRTRSPCPPELLERLVELADGRDVLDVGCGTGIVSRQLAGAGCRVLGVEPDERMAEFARSTGVSVEVSGFESWDPAGRKFGLVVASSSWHWVDPLAGAATAARSLAPAGWLAPFWHTYELPEPVARAYDDALRRVAPTSALRPWFGPARRNAYAAVFDKVTAGMRDTRCFDDPVQQRVDWDQRFTRAQWLDRMPTQGSLDGLSRTGQRDVLDRVGAAIDDVGSAFVIRNSTVAITARRNAHRDGRS